MLRLFFAVLLVIGCALASADDFVLHIGERLRLRASPGAVVKVSSRSVLKVVDGQSHIDVIAHKPGYSEILIGLKTHHIRVTWQEQKLFLRELQKTLLSWRGLKLNLQGENVRLQGTLLRFQDWLDLADLAQASQGEYSFQAKTLPDVTTEALAHFQKLIREAKLPPASFHTTPFLSIEIGKVSPELNSKYERVLKPFGLKIEMDKSQLEVEPLVQTRVVLAEVSQHVAREFGMVWPSEYQAQLLPRFNGTEDLLTKLRLYEGRGQAQVLAAPNLLCRSGSEASFHAGGEFPIRMRGRRAASVTWKQHGVLLKVRPQADHLGHIRLQIETEISLLDTSQSVDGIPALKTNSVNSQFDITNSKTVALSGLLRRELGQASEGLPLLSRLPVIGPLFSSRIFQDQQSELVIFVTPEIQAPKAE